LHDANSTEEGEEEQRHMKTVPSLIKPLQSRSKRIAASWGVARKVPRHPLEGVHTPEGEKIFYWGKKDTFAGIAERGRSETERYVFQEKKKKGLSEGKSRGNSVEDERPSTSPSRKGQLLPLKRS